MLTPGTFLLPNQTVRDFEDSFRSTGCDFFKSVEPFERENWQYPQDVKSLLVFNTGALGDQIMMTAPVSAIKKRMPQCQIDVVCNQTHGLWDNSRDVRALRWEFLSVDVLKHYDAYFIVDEDVARLTGAHQQNCYHKLFEMAGLPYEGEQPKIYLSALDEMQAFTLASGVSAGRSMEVSGNYVVLGLHASRHTRDISIEQWCEIADSIAGYGKDVENFTIYTLANNEYGHRIQAAITAKGHVPLYQTLNIRQIAALLRQAMCVVSVDSMAVHLAAAVQAPCVGIYTTVPAEARIATYPPFIVGLYDPDCCRFAGCSWKHDTFSEHKADIAVTSLCYTSTKEFCDVGRRIKAAHVLACMEKAMNAKNEFDGFQAKPLPIYKN